MSDDKRGKACFQIIIIDEEKYLSSPTKKVVEENQIVAGFLS